MRGSNPVVGSGVSFGCWRADYASAFQDALMIGCDPRDGAARCAGARQQADGRPLGLPRLLAGRRRAPAGAHDDGGARARGQSLPGATCQPPGRTSLAAARRAAALRPAGQERPSARRRSASPITARSCRRCPAVRPLRRGRRPCDRGPRAPPVRRSRFALRSHPIRGGHAYRPRICDCGCRPQ